MNHGIFTRIAVIVLASLLILFASGCQGDSSSSITVTPVSPTPAPPTELPTSSIDRSTITVPQGEPPVIDGTISPGEWDSASVETFSDGSELLLVNSEGYLYVGIRAKGPEMITGNVFINRGNQIAVLHSSAALGTALYEEGIESWQQTQAFDWCCRMTGKGEAARAERDDFLMEEHWVTTNARTGSPNEHEYQIEVSNETLRLAVNYIKVSEPNSKIPFPKDLDDDCIKPTPGGLPEQLHFVPDKWAVISLIDSGG